MIILKKLKMLKFKVFKGIISKLKSNKFLKNLLFFVLALMINCMIFSFISCDIDNVSGSKTTVEKGIEVEVEIKQGSTLNKIAQLLEEKGIIDSAFVFKLYVQQKGKEKNLLPGRYILLTGSDYDSVLNEITTQESVVTYKLVIPEGFTVDQIEERILQDIPFIESSELKDALKIDDYLDVYDFLNNDTKSLEGFLFPKTYEITIDYSAKNIIEMFLTQFQFETQTLNWAKIEQYNLNKYDIIKIASLIEREAYMPGERELISAVIHNRLKKNMLLQVDATVRYALNKWDGIVTFDDLEIDSPYNTYKYYGLPPTPICNPGLDSIKAAINPADVDYLYYVVIDENTHEHKFSTTLEEHEKAKNQ